jgi:predicted RNA-binding Zn ribbon-like protein
MNGRMNGKLSSADHPRAARNPTIVPRRDLCLDFVNTLMWRGSAPTETLHNVGELLNWAAAAGTLPQRADGDLIGWCAAHPTPAAAIFADALEIREVIYRLLRSAASGKPPARDDLQRLNHELGKAPPRTILDHTGSSFGWRVDVKPTVPGILAPVLWSAADILVSADLKRLRQCANKRCLWLFFDDSKNRTRRWCSMQACGNRAKAQRHYLRQKAQ